MAGAVGWEVVRTMSWQQHVCAQGTHAKCMVAHRDTGQSTCYVITLGASRPVNAAICDSSRAAATSVDSASCASNERGIGKCCQLAQQTCGAHCTTRLSYRHGQSMLRGVRLVALQVHPNGCSDTPLPSTTTTRSDYTIGATMNSPQRRTVPDRRNTTRDPLVK